MFCFGSSVVMGVSSNVAQDSWMSLLLGVAFAVPVVLMYGRIVSLNRGLDLFAILETVLGRFFGKLAVALMSWYALHLCALVLRNFSEFIQLTALLDTPQLPVLVIMALTVGFLAKAGGKALGKWALATILIVLSIVVLTVTLSLNIMQFQNLLPVMTHEPAEILKDAFQIFSFPFAETVLFLGIADCISRHDNPVRIYLVGTLFGGLVLLVIMLRNMFALGPAVVAVEYFPSYAAVRLINLGDFLSRIEGSISINFILAGITKITLCLIVASRGLARLFDVEDYRKLVVPVALMAVALATVVYRNIMEMFGFLKFYAPYALPFQVALPALVWIASEVRARRAGKGEEGGAREGEGEGEAAGAPPLQPRQGG